MCGIVGYVGKREALPIIMEGLKRLEYRGYDSAGIALFQDDKLLIRKCVGKVSQLEDNIKDIKTSGTIGMGHTRWATHGIPNNVNAHPHTDCHNQFALIHNGVIENYAAMKTKLEALGHIFKSDTDTEVLVHFIEELYKKHQDLDYAVRGALNEVTGTYGIIVSTTYDPHSLIVARRGSPLVIGYGDGEVVIASDASALIEHTRKVAYLEDGEIAIVTSDDVVVKTLDDIAIDKDIEELTFDLDQIEKGGYDHFMLKEIHEQPDTIQNAMRGRLLRDEGTIKLGGLDGILEKILNAERLIFAACGTSWHAALIGEYMLEQYAQIPVVVEYAS